MNIKLYIAQTYVIVCACAYNLQVWNDNISFSARNSYANKVSWKKDLTVEEFDQLAESLHNIHPTFLKLTTSIFHSSSTINFRDHLAEFALDGMRADITDRSKKLKKADVIGNYLEAKKETIPSIAEYANFSFAAKKVLFSLASLIFFTESVREHQPELAIGGAFAASAVVLVMGVESLLDNREHAIVKSNKRLQKAENWLDKVKSEAAQSLDHELK